MTTELDQRIEVPDGVPMRELRGAARLVAARYRR